MTETTRNGPSITDCLEAAMRADPSLTIEEAIRTVPVSEATRQAGLAIAAGRQCCPMDTYDTDTAGDLRAVCTCGDGCDCLCRDCDCGTGCGCGDGDDDERE